MNLFITSPDPYQCAKYLADHRDWRRLNKQILECAQILSTNAHVLGRPDLAPYKPTHENHPVTKWVRETRLNSFWTIRFIKELHYFYQNKFNREHKTITLHLNKLIQAASLPQVMKETPFYNCSGFDTGDVFEDYKLCLKKKWEEDEIKKSSKKDTLNQK